MDETLSDRIRVARCRIRMSQAELARRIGISATAMNQIEAHDVDFRVSRLTAMARTLQVSADYLLGLGGEGAA